MKQMIRIQLFLFALILGFLTGPRVMEAIQKTDNRTSDASSPKIVKTEEVIASVGASNVRPLLVADPYAKLTLSAKSVFVWDIQSHRKLYGLHEEDRLSLASVTKIMTALVARESLTPETHVLVTNEDLLQEGDNGLYAQETWKLKDLLNFTLITSSNDGASAIARGVGNHFSASSSPEEAKKIFVERMNEKARIMNLTHTHFFNESGLDRGINDSGAYGSTRDMAMLFEYIFKKYPDILTPTTNTSLNITSEDNIIHHAVNTNEGVEHITGIIASKTGYTDLAGGNLVIIFDVGLNHPVVIAVLGSTHEGRFADVHKLINATIEKITGEAPSLEN